MRPGVRLPGLGHVIELFLPAACAGCSVYLGGAGRDREGICARCLSRLSAPPHPRCPRCDAPRGTGLPEDRPCPECAGWPGILRSARAAAVLRPPADTLVHQLKYGGWSELAGPMSARMARIPIPQLRAFQDIPIVPVPTTAHRLRSRGYNQAQALAEGLALRWGGEVVDALSRGGSEGSQVALQREERRANVQDAFSLTSRGGVLVPGRDVLLVDDVLTTGATAVAAAEVLGRGGARSVSVLTFARTLPA